MAHDTAPGPPPRPDTSGHDFAATLRMLKGWSGLKLVSLQARNDKLPKSSVSDRLRGLRAPEWEFVHAFVTECLTAQGWETVAIAAELRYWRDAWIGLRQGPQPQPTVSAAEPAPGRADSTDAGDVSGPSGDDDPQRADDREQAVPEPVAVQTRSGAEPEEVAGPHPSAVGASSADASRGWRLSRRVTGRAAAAAAAVSMVAVVAASGALGEVDGADSTAVEPTSVGVGEDPPAVPDRTYTQTVHTPAGARTYTNPYNLIGEGPRIDDGKAIEVSCMITFTSTDSPSVGVHWYQIVSPPWGNRYYSPANAFLNGDPAEGPYTRAVDEAVPQCPQ